MWLSGLFSGLFVRAFLNEALLEACPIRMRPVLMTSLTVVLALSPATWSARGCWCAMHGSVPVPTSLFTGQPGGQGTSLSLHPSLTPPRHVSLLESVFEQYVVAQYDAGELNVVDEPAGSLEPRVGNMEESNPDFIPIICSKVANGR